MILFGEREVGAGAPCLIVAELGTSHMGDAERARRLADAAADAGADCVKVQLVYADEILHPLSGEVELPTGRVELYRHFKDLERDVSFFADLKKHVEERGLLFLSSAFGLRSAHELKSMGVKTVKIASPELNHYPLLREVSGYGIPLVLSSGVSTLADIERAIAITGRRVVLLHCVTAYPAPEEDYNLRILAGLRGIFGVEAGVSDHSLDPFLVPVLSVLNGACIIEKHFTLSRMGNGLDDPVALEPSPFRRMVEAVRAAESDGAAAREKLVREHGVERISRVEGSGRKELAASEAAHYGRTNRSIHALVDIPRGAPITADSVSILRTEKKLRPGLGPEFLSLVVGANAKRRIPAGEGVMWEDLI